MAAPNESSLICSTMTILILVMWGPAFSGTNKAALRIFTVKGSVHIANHFGYFLKS